jgi:hypothetical protein
VWQFVAVSRRYQTPGLRLRSARQLEAERLERVRQESRELYARSHPGSVVETFIEETLREANRPPDDEWEALA